MMSNTLDSENVIGWNGISEVSSYKMHLVIIAPVIVAFHSFSYMLHLLLYYDYL